MESKSYLSWVEFYSAFATSLLDYSKDRKALIVKLQAVYKSIGLKFPRLTAARLLPILTHLQFLAFLIKASQMKIGLLFSTVLQRSFPLPLLFLQPLMEFLCSTI